MMVRFEDLCDDPNRVMPALLEFAGCHLDKLDQTCALVHKPTSIGRWQSFGSAEVETTVHRGREYLATLGYKA